MPKASDILLTAVTAQAVQGKPVLSGQPKNPAQNAAEKTDAKESFSNLVENEVSEEQASLKTGGSEKNSQTINAEANPDQNTTAQEAGTNTPENVINITGHYGAGENQNVPVANGPSTKETTQTVASTQNVSKGTVSAEANTQNAPAPEKTQDIPLSSQHKNTAENVVGDQTNDHNSGNHSGKSVDQVVSSSSAETKTDPVLKTATVSPEQQVQTQSPNHTAPVENKDKVLTTAEIPAVTSNASGKATEETNSAQAPKTNVLPENTAKQENTAADVKTNSTPTAQNTEVDVPTQQETQQTLTATPEKTTTQNNIIAATSPVATVVAQQVSNPAPVKETSALRSDQQKKVSAAGTAIASTSDKSQAASEATKSVVVNSSETTKTASANNLAHAQGKEFSLLGNKPTLLASGQPLFSDLLNATSQLPQGQNPAQIGTANLSSPLGIQDVSQPGSTMATAQMATKSMPSYVNTQITTAISQHLANGQKTFRMQLFPAELGQVDVRMEFASDGKMQAFLTVDNERTLSLLQRDQASLERALQQNGFDTSQNNLNFSLKRQDQEQQTAEQKNGSSAQDDQEHMDPALMAQDQQIQIHYSDKTLDISV